MALHGLLPGDPVTLGPYELRGRLGAGGMGVVYLGFGPDGQAVAVKTLPGSASTESRERMRREARVLGSLNSPGVASLLAADTDAGTPWLALAYVSGPSLLEATTPLRPAPLRQFAHGLAEALSVLHQAGITHRDVKPANVILTFDGPVLVDLGIARTQDMTSMTQAGTVIGSAGWMSPEQLRGKAEGPASDVWGWGAVLVYAATGRPPFGEGALEAIAWRIQSLEPDLEGVPGWLVPAVRGALAKDPAARPPARELLPAAPGAGDQHDRQVAEPPAMPTRIVTGPQSTLRQAPAQAPPAPPPAPPPPARPVAQHPGAAQNPARPGAALNPGPPLPTPYRPPAAPTQVPYPAPPGGAGYPYQQAPAQRRRRGRRTVLIVALVVLVLAGLGGVAAVVLTSRSSAKLAAPENFQAVVTPSGVNLSWDAVKSADHYAVFRDAQSIDNSVAGTSYTDPTGATAPHSYYVYAVSSAGKAGEKSESVPTVPPPDDSASPSPSTSAGLSGADQALADRLPSEVADSSTCVHSKTFESPVTIAAVSCATASTPTTGAPPQRIYAYQDKSPADFRQHFTDNTKQFTPTNTDCNNPPSRDSWVFLTDKTTTVGTRLCYVDKNVNKPTIQWTYDAQGIALLAVGSDIKPSALLAWWAHVDLRLK